MNSKHQELESLLTAGKTPEAIALIKTARNYDEGEWFVGMVLGADPGKAAPSEVMEAALEAFANTRNEDEHGLWVHSLSHFTRHLWQRRMTKWIRKLNEIAFQSDANCSNRLVSDFSQYARWDDNPLELGYTPKNLAWIDRCENEEYRATSRNQINVSPFPSEEAFLRWQLSQPLLVFDNEVRTGLVDVTKFQEIQARLTAIGAETSDLPELERKLHQSHLQRMETELTTCQKWQMEGLKKGIAKTRQLLGEL